MGSNPLVPNGVHLINLFNINIIPFKKPYFSKAWIAYEEQVG
jgi:hypothetical protein